MNTLDFFIELAQDNGYIAKCIQESIFTEADTLEEIKQNIKEAVLCHFDENDAPSVVHLHFFQHEVLTV